MEKAEIKILGHSGCLVEIVENFSDICIRKATLNNHYMDRLKAQITKQKQFSVLFNSVQVPKIYGEYTSPHVYFAEMQYITGLDIFTFFDVASKDDLDKFFNVIEDYLSESLSLSEMMDFPLDKIYQKLSSLELDFTDTLPSANRHISRLKCVLVDHTFPSIPIGFCHGDLTFSNILVEPDCENIYFIDLLDSFLESPIQDIVKLKQDIIYHWSTKKTVQSFDVCRSKIIFAYFNKRLDKFIEKHFLNKAVVSLFQIINLLRILPYTDDFELINYLHACIENEFKNLESSL